MNMKRYLKDSARTASTNYYHDAVPIQEIVEILNNIESHAEGELDIVKKQLFYKKPDHKRSTLNYCEPDVVHALIGIITEAGELCGPLSKYIETAEINKINLKEEAGDILWYLAMLFRALGTDFETVAETNLNKLKIRYPDKFTEEKALNRDIQLELGVLQE